MQFVLILKAYIAICIERHGSPLVAVRSSCQSSVMQLLSIRVLVRAIHDSFELTMAGRDVDRRWPGQYGKPCGTHNGL
jgi:hypothetical protein